MLKVNIKTSVPPFIEIGDKVVISTSDASYLEKAKKYVKKSLWIVKFHILFSECL